MAAVGHLPGTYSAPTHDKCILTTSCSKAEGQIGPALGTLTSSSAAAQRPQEPLEASLLPSLCTEALGLGLHPVLVELPTAGEQQVHGILAAVMLQRQQGGSCPTFCWQHSAVGSGQAAQGCAEW